jgi:type VI secretion system ImpC/EvpB family protein
VRWLGVEPARALISDKQTLLRRLDRDIARLDELLSAQVNAILHHPRFQKLEASWRGLRYLTEQAAERENVRIRVLDASWKTLSRDLDRAIEFDQSQLFNKVYSEEFGTPGGEPFGVLIGDYEVRHRPGPEHPVDDVAVLLRGIAQVAAAAFAPFIAAAHPALFGLNSFRDLSLPTDVSAVFQQREYLPWNTFRGSEDARFVGLTLPRVLMRKPYEDDGSRIDGFRFHERVEGPDNSRYLWGNAAYAFAGVLIRAFAEQGWLANIRGVREGSLEGGLVTGLPVHAFSTDREGLVPKCSTDVVITDAQDKELAELGFIPLCRCKDTEWSAFYSTPSVQRPDKGYDNIAAAINARLSTMLQYMLCVARFGHYLKVIGRDKLASFSSPAECERYLQRWLLDYVTSSEDASFEVKAKYPLREASVQVREQPGKPENYLCVVHLRPHFQLEQVVSTVRLVTELTVGAPR